MNEPTEKPLRQTELNEVLLPGQIGVRHVRQDFEITPLTQVLEAAVADRRHALAFFLRRYIAYVRRRHDLEALAILDYQVSHGLIERVDPAGDDHA